MNEKTMYAVCVAKKHRASMCHPKKIWVKNAEHQLYVSLKERGLWETKEEALSNVFHFEEVVKVLVPNPGRPDDYPGQ